MDSLETKKNTLDIDPVNINENNLIEVYAVDSNQIATVADAVAIGGQGTGSNKCIRLFELGSYGCCLKTTPSQQYDTNQLVKYSDITKAGSTIHMHILVSSVPLVKGQSYTVKLSLADGTNYSMTSSPAYGSPSGMVQTITGLVDKYWFQMGTKTNTPGATTTAPSATIGSTTKTNVPHTGLGSSQTGTSVFLYHGWIV